MYGKVWWIQWGWRRCGDSGWSYFDELSDLDPRQWLHRRTQGGGPTDYYVAFAIEIDDPRPPCWDDCGNTANDPDFRGCDDCDMREPR